MSLNIIKSILIFVTMLVTGVMAVNGAVFYEIYHLNFETDIPSDVYVTGAECTDSGCTDVNNNKIKVYQGDDAIICIDNYKSNSNYNSFSSCMNSARVSNGYVSTVSNDYVVTAMDIPSRDGYLTWFLASDDSYITYYFNSYDFQCDFDFCYSLNEKEIYLNKKADAIAEVGQLNVKNTNDELLPIQVEVPVEIEETVCSAFRYTQPDMWRPSIPQDYSDFSIKTNVSLTISNNGTSEVYSTQYIIVDIEADTCQGLAAFSWTPSSDLENESIKFRVETHIIDNQVSSYIMDWAEVIEVVYPTNLNDTCWTRAFNFTMSNIESFDLSTSVAQITRGESLYAMFEAGAFTGEDKTPIDFEARLLFDNTLVYQEVLFSGSSLQSYSVDLRDEVLDLDVGSYNVTLITTPVGGDCSISEGVEQTQNLQILAPEEFEVTFHINDRFGNPLDNVSINFELLDADDFYLVDPTYNELLFTDNSGIAVFEDVLRGDYSYLVSLSGYQSVSNQIHVGSDADIYITLLSGGNENNSAPEIVSFYAIPDSGFAPLNTVFTINVADIDSDDLTCTLDLGDGNSVNDFCDNLNNYPHTYAEGDYYTAVLTVSDGEFVAQASEVINVYGEEERLGNLDMELNIEPKVQPGDFTFELIIENESMDRRFVSIKPYLVCDEATGMLSDYTRFMSQGIVSTESTPDGFVYILKSRTMDYNIDIPLDTKCTFNVDLVDNFGDTKTLSQPVMFGYETQDLVTSIRGNSVDIMNYMGSAISNNIRPGYNSIEFTIDNNIPSGKELEISITSRSLGVIVREEVDLTSRGLITVQLPLFIKDDLEPGMYPIRFSISDDEDKQVRYSYVKVN